MDSPEENKLGQYSYVLWDEIASFASRKNKIEIESNNKVTKLTKEPFSQLQSFYKKYQKTKKQPKSFFTGGLVGYLSYEVNGTFETLPKPKEDKELEFLPDIYFIVPKNVVVFDHFKNKIHLFVHGTAEEKTKQEFEFLIRSIKEYLKGTLRSNFNGKSVSISNLKPQIKKPHFKRMVQKAKSYIAAGDIYQANLSQRFSFDHKGSLLRLYQKLREINPSPFSSYLETKDFTIVSSSPERLVRVEKGVCETRPIAGTRRRGKNKKEDGKLSKELLLNEKEQAEHLMLVDLERNDLGRVCDFNTVHVDEWMTLEKYSHVIHIVSNVKGKLSKNKNNFDVIRTMFPGGTITGCPKIRSMEVIHELEPTKRSLYTGSIGYIDFSGLMDLNIVIRTILCSKKKGYVQVGAGIVHDSDPEREYEETLHKAEAMFEALRGS